MYAGNVGFSQSLEMVVAAARAIPDATFVINGQGAARPQLEAAAAGLANVRFGDHQPAGRLNEVLATGDVHVVPLRRGLGRVSVPSKIYSILAAGRPVVAAIDTDSEVSRIVTATGCGVVVAPDDTEAFIEGDPRRARHRRPRCRHGAGRTSLGREVGVAQRRRPPPTRTLVSGVRRTGEPSRSTGPRQGIGLARR